MTDESELRAAVAAGALAAREGYRPLLQAIVEVARAIFAAKGWAYYSHNAFFWAKIAGFAAIGLLSVPPTLEFFRWKKSYSAPADAAVRSVRRYLHIELMLFVLLPIFAAAMARGYGEF